MEFIEHKTAKGMVVEIRSDEVVISSEQDALDIMANIGYLYDSSKSLKEFLLENNKGHQVNFLSKISDF